jgi:hypothetical protein
VSAISPLVQTQAEALLRRVARDGATRVLAERRAGEERVRELLAEARREARARVQAAIAEERRLHDRALAERRAALDTESRRRDHELLGTLVAQAWQRLPDALAARWNDPAGRREWCLAAGAQASESLPAEPGLVVEVDAGADAAQRSVISESLRLAGLVALRLEGVPGLGAGLRLRAGAARVDATVAGLLCVREQVEAALLIEIEGRLAARLGSP